jgi:hypothetical protein
MDVFLRLYGFCRNFSFICLVAAAACFYRAALPRWRAPAISAWGLLFVFLAVFHRYLKFFRAYGAEVLSTYAEP